MPALTLNKVMIDWMTITSFREEIYKLGRKLQEDFGNQPYDANAMQYKGYAADTMNGRIFAGTGYQKGLHHHLLRLEGGIADGACAAVSGVWRKFEDNLTRVDFQVTIVQPDNWSQWGLLERLRKRGNTVGWRQSRDKATGLELATVYCGNRASSPRFLRVYQKLTDDGTMLLRLEVEIKRKRSRQLGKYMQEFGSGDMSKGRDELKLMSQKDSKLEMAYASVLEGWQKPITVGRWDTDTAAWIKNQCLPAIGRYVNDHNSSQAAEIISMLKLIIESTER